MILLVSFLAFAPRPARAAADMFPPVERLLGGIHAPAPPIVENDLRDSLNSARGISALRSELRSFDWKRRQAAVAEAGRPGNDAAVPYLGAALLQLNEDARVRVAAAMGLARIGHANGGRYLQEALGDPEVDVRFAAAFALSRLRPEGSVAHLTRALRQDPSWWVRYAAAIALGRAGKPFAVDALAAAAASDGAWQVRLEAARALGEIRSPRSADALAAPLQDVDAGVRGTAAIALGELGGDAAVDRLRDALSQETDLVQRGLLGRALRRALR